jgi:hypothetical protein
MAEQDRLGQQQQQLEEEVQQIQQQVRQHLEAEVQKIQQQARQQPETSRRIYNDPRGSQEVGSPKIKAPTFDGTTSFTIFKLQFETTAATNLWDHEKMAAALVVALKGSAAETLTIIPQHNLQNYNKIMEVLQRRYGSEHKKQIYQMEFSTRKQLVNESLNVWCIWHSKVHSSKNNK